MVSNIIYIKMIQFRVLSILTFISIILFIKLFQKKKKDKKI